MIASMQTQMLFPTGAVGPAGPLPAGAMQVSIETPDGNTLHGVHIPPATATQKPRTLILGFGGNAWNGSDVAAFLHQIYPQADVIAFHYRGYRPSTGSPSAKALLADAPLVHKFAVERVKPDRTIAVGFSIGSGVAASLARSRSGGSASTGLGERRPLDGMILVTPFDSLKTAASDLYPWLPIGPFFEHEMNAAEFLKGSNLPVAIIAGEYDTLIRPARTEALRSQVPNLAFDKIIAGAGHNDIYLRPEFQQAMREALVALGGAR
jgi:pimeloyl-ACP methyl ester carboxylesterase